LKHAKERKKGTDYAVRAGRQGDKEIKKVEMEKRTPKGKRKIKRQGGRREDKARERLKTT
jgi:hypothetical protein